MVIAALIGIPIGIVSAERERLWRGVQAIIDTLQTLPSFAHLMPAVMLFRVGDFTAMIAVVAYSIAPAIRYTALGLKQVFTRAWSRRAVRWAARAGSCSPKIKLKLALP